MEKYDISAQFSVLSTVYYSSSFSMKQVVHLFVSFTVLSFFVTDIVLLMYL